VASRVLFLFLVAPLKESGSESPETPAPQQGQIDLQTTFCHKPAWAAGVSARSWSRPACQFWMFDFPPHAVPSSLLRFFGLFYSLLCSVWLCWLVGFGSWARRPVAAASLVDLLCRFVTSIYLVRLCGVFFPFGFVVVSWSLGDVLVCFHFHALRRAPLHCRLLVVSVTPAASNKAIFTPTPPQSVLFVQR